MICKCIPESFCRSSYNRVYVPIDGVDVQLWVDRGVLHARWQAEWFAGYGFVDDSPESQIVKEFVLSFPGLVSLRWSRFDEIDVPDNVISAIKSLMSTRPNKRQDVSAYGPVRSDDLIMGQLA